MPATNEPHQDRRGGLDERLGDPEHRTPEDRLRHHLILALVDGSSVESVRRCRSVAPLGSACRRSPCFSGPANQRGSAAASKVFEVRRSPRRRRPARRARLAASVPTGSPGSRRRAPRTGRSPRSMGSRAYRCRRRSRGASWRCPGRCSRSVVGPPPAALSPTPRANWSFSSRRRCTASGNVFGLCAGMTWPTWSSSWSWPRPGNAPRGSPRARAGRSRAATRYASVENRLVVFTRCSFDVDRVRLAAAGLTRSRPRCKRGPARRP